MGECWVSTVFGGLGASETKHASCCSSRELCGRRNTSVSKGMLHVEGNGELYVKAMGPRRRLRAHRAGAIGRKVPQLGRNNSSLEAWKARVQYVFDYPYCLDRRCDWLARGHRFLQPVLLVAPNAPPRTKLSHPPLPFSLFFLLRLHLLPSSNNLSQLFTSSNPSAPSKNHLPQCSLPAD